MVAATVLSGCADSTPNSGDASPGRVVPEAEVERFRIEVARGLREVDAALVQFEAQAQLADSTTRASYRARLDSLLDARRRLQIRLDSLAARPRPAFEAARAEVRHQTQALDRGVERALFELAPDAAAVRALAVPRLTALDRRTQALAPDSADLRAREYLQGLRDMRTRLDRGLARLNASRGDPLAFETIRVSLADTFAALRGSIADPPILLDSTALRTTRSDSLQHRP